MMDTEIYKQKMDEAYKNNQFDRREYIKDKMATERGTEKELVEIKKRIEREAKKLNREAYAKYSTENDQILADFKRELEITNGLCGHPKAQTLFYLAWEHGHYSGLDNVVCYYEEFMVLLEE